MTVLERYEPFFQRQSSLGWRVAEQPAGRFDNAVVLAYYACFQWQLELWVPEDRRGGYSHGVAPNA